MEIQSTEYGTRLGDVEFIWARNSKEFLFANSIYIRGTPNVIVDPSAAFTYIERLALSHSVDLVLNTHYHGDHRSLNTLFKKVIFAAHELDAPAIKDYAVYEKFCDANPASFYTEWRKQVFKQYHIHDCPVTQYYKDGDVIETGGERIRILHLPGHTPGHLGLFFEKIDCLYVSDIDLTPYGPWYANVVSDIDQFRASVEKVKSIEAQHYVTSHGERIYTPEKFHEKIDRFYRQFFERDEKILSMLKESPKTMVDLCSEGIIYRRASLIDPLKAYFQWQMVEKHLDRFIRQGQVVCEGDVYLLK